jgi:hypothetical protein
MNHNPFEDLPSDIFNITTLRYLYIKRNLIDDADLKAVIAKMKITNPSLDIKYSD